MAEIVVNGSRTYYEDTGSGSPVVLVHGLGGTGAAIWKKVLPGLAGDFRVITYDLRGSGRSEVTPGPYSIGLLAGDLDALTRALGLDSPALVGHSMGGSIVLAQAAKQAGRVRAVVGVGAPTELPEAGRAGMKARAETVEADGMGAVAETVATNGTAPSFREEHPDEFRALVSLLESNDVAGYAAQCRALVELDLTGELAKITAPTLLVAGDLDGVSPPAMNEATAASVPNARYAQVADCGHILPWEKPEALLDAVRPLLQETA